VGARVRAARGRGGRGGGVLAAYYLRNVWNFDALKRCSCVLRAISFYNVRLFLCLLLFACFTYKYSILFYISGGIFKFSGCHFQLSTLLRCIRFYPKNSFENMKTDVKIGIFPIPIACSSGFGIFKQNLENPDEIGMVGKCEIPKLARNSSVMYNEIRFLIFGFLLRLLRITTEKRLHMNVTVWKSSGICSSC